MCVPQLGLLFIGVILPNGSGGHSYHEDDHSVLMQADSQTENMNVHEGPDEKKSNRNRPRKRKLYADVCKQMEFYFSDANITKNRMMRDIVEKANQEAEGYVDLTVFLDFTKIQHLTNNIHHIQKALRNSKKLELSPDELKAKRKVAFDPVNLKSDDAVEECTIYVENIPRDAEHEWLEKIFQAFGPVAYISLPKFKSGQHKGFGFVEFDDVEAARSCLEAYGEDGACLPSDINPAELRSIKSFNEEQAGTSKSSGNHSKRRAGEALAQDDDEPKSKKKRHDGSSSSSDEHESKNVENGDNDAEVCTSTVKKTRKKRKKNKAKKTGEAKLESESIMLKVLPKKTWRQLRNRYLNLQRSNMAKLKKQLQKDQIRAQHFKNFYQPQHQQEQDHYEQPASHNATKYEHEPHAEYSETRTLDHIMEIKLTEPAESTDSFRHKITVELAEQDEDEAMISGFIKFVDYKENGCQAYVRVNADESFSTRAESLLTRAGDAFASARFLSGKK